MSRHTTLNYNYSLHHRIVLLLEKSPRTRTEMYEMLDVKRSTLSDCLKKMVEKRWIKKLNPTAKYKQKYVLTKRFEQRLLLHDVLYIRVHKRHILTKFIGV